MTAGSLSVPGFGIRSSPPSTVELPLLSPVRNCGVLSVIVAPTVGDAAKYMLENQLATVAVHDGAPLYVELPPSVELLISYTEPGLVGDRSTSGTKPATLENGASIQVPLFIVTGEKVKVDTRTGEYTGRVN